MNRIILIGNGFDLAHNMPTSYTDFINNYWKVECLNAKTAGNCYENEIFNISTCQYNINSIIGSRGVNSYKELVEYISSFNRTYPSAKARIEFKRLFFEDITKQVRLKKWVDIEDEYYKQLKEYSACTPIGLGVERLNGELKFIEELLCKYLITIEGNYSSDSIIPQIKKKIYSKFKFQDLSFPSSELYIKEIKQKVSEIAQNGLTNKQGTRFYDTYKDSTSTVRHICDYAKNVSNEDLEFNIRAGALPDYFMMPEDIMFLNFNYTHTEKKYITSSIIEVVHIHGEINNKDNPVIFGYGDELGQDYQRIENLGDNECLKNMKSIRYTETDNYKKLLAFVESDLYQISIMGHSCGTSDRTLLNTLFEHKNCASIKPFYHKINNEEDNFSDIARSISRNFTDKTLMRDRVVNKTYCEPLVEQKAVLK